MTSAAPSVIGSTKQIRDTARSPFRADIQGMRALAVLLVVAYHTGALGVVGGYVGVDVFFVISGFLITNHLVAQLAERGKITFGDFYARRARRILPASFTVLLATIVAVMVFTPAVLRPRDLWDSIWTALYVPNMSFAAQGTQYLSESAPSPFQHYWSLGVEEQFYLVWPVALMLMWFIAKRSKRLVAIATVVVVVVSLVGCIWLTQASQPWAFFSLPSRAWELGAGALIAIVGRQAAQKTPGWMRSLGGWLGLASLLLAGFAYDAHVTFPGYAALLPVVGAALVIFCGQEQARFSPTRLLSIRPLTFIGEISYSMYLVHWPILTIAAVAYGGQLPAWEAIVLGVLSVPVAWVLYRLIENPMRNLPWLASRKPRWTLLVFTVVTALTIALAGGGLAVASVSHIDSGKDAASIPEPVAYPEFTPFVPKNMTPTLAEASKDIPTIYGNDCHLGTEETAVQKCAFGLLTSSKVIALFGDSHAAQWFPPLDKIATAQNLRLESYSKSSCPSVDVPIYVDNVLYSECQTWRDNVIAHLVANPPEVIVLSNMMGQPDQPNGGATMDEWASGLAEVIARLPATSSVIVLADTPRMGQTPAICLSQHVNDAFACTVPRAKAVDEEWQASTQKAVAGAGATYVTMNDFICNRTECGTIIGTTLVYRDDNHITATFAEELSDELWLRLQPFLSATGSVP